MIDLSPESPELIAHYQKNLKEYSCICNALSIPHFSKQSIEDLSKLLQSTENAQLVEAVSRLGNFSDFSEQARMRKAVSSILHKRGVKLPRGKRTRPELQNLAECLIPLFLYFGIPLASSERSKLVRALRLVAEETGVGGDPRDFLRRAIQIEKRVKIQQKKMILEAVAKGLSQLSTTPSNISLPSY